MPKTYVVENAGVRSLSYPVEDLDFSSDGSYSGYNWELFFHVPLLIATRLTTNQRFEEALTWFHYMFNPTGALAGDAPEKYWVTKPFFQTHDQRLHRSAHRHPAVQDRRPEHARAARSWNSPSTSGATKPFKPHVVARFRPVAYQKAHADEVHRQPHGMGRLPVPARHDGGDRPGHADVHPGRQASRTEAEDRSRRGAGAQRDLQPDRGQARRVRQCPDRSREHPARSVGAARGRRRVAAAADHAVDALLLHSAERQDARVLGHASPTACSRSATA